MTGPTNLRKGALLNSGTPSPNPWDLTLSRLNVCSTLKALERRIGLRRDATRAPIQRPEWQGAASPPPQTQTQTPPDLSLLTAKIGLDNGVHFTSSPQYRTANRPPPPAIPLDSAIDRRTT
jgi:hypothetical protein